MVADLQFNPEIMDTSFAFFLSGCSLFDIDIFPYPDLFSALQTNLYIIPFHKADGNW